MVWSSLHHKEADFLICNPYPKSYRSSMISGTVADWRPKSHTAAAFQLRWLTSFSSCCTQAKGLSTVACGLCCIRAMRSWHAAWGYYVCNIYKLRDGVEIKPVLTRTGRRVRMQRRAKPWQEIGIYLRSSCKELAGCIRSAPQRSLKRR